MQQRRHLQGHQEGRALVGAGGVAAVVGGEAPRVGADGQLRQQLALGLEQRKLKGVHALPQLAAERVLVGVRVVRCASQGTDAGSGG